jgi:hypothetical protein
LAAEPWKVLHGTGCRSEPATPGPIGIAGNTFLGLVSAQRLTIGNVPTRQRSKTSDIRQSPAKNTSAAGRQDTSEVFKTQVNQLLRFFAGAAAAPVARMPK